MLNGAWIGFLTEYWDESLSNVEYVVVAQCG